MNGNVKIITKIYGVESRRDMINTTANKLFIPEENIFLDDRPNGGSAIYTAKKAYLSDHGSATHGIFLQDDVEVCDNFLDICYKIIETHPDKIISLFPFDYQKEYYCLENLNTPYVNVYTLSACGIIMPIKYIKPCFDWIKETFNDEMPDDISINLWADANHIKVITTIPALIQHIGDDSIICPNCFIRRTVYYRKNPVADWGNKEVFLVPNPNSIFYPKSKKILKPGGNYNDY